MCHQRPILIVGAGAAGLTLARSIALRGRAVQVFDRQIKRLDRGLGIWGRSQAALRALGLSSLLDDADRTLRIPAAAYRSRRGDWLSACSNTAANHVRVNTLRESHLLKALEEGLPSGCVVRDVELIDVKTSTKGVELTFDNGDTIQGAAVVGADGVHSTVRALLRDENNVRMGLAEATGFESHSGLLLPEAGAEAMRLGGSVHRNFFEQHVTHDDLSEGLLRNAAPVCDSSSVRGRGWGSGSEITGDSAAGSGGSHQNANPMYSAPSSAASCSAHAFETLSAGRRFAMVPLAGGGAFWFGEHEHLHEARAKPSTIPHTALDHAHPTCYPWPPQLILRCKPCLTATRPILEIERRSPCEGTDATALRALRDAYEGWHEPIPRVLHFAACAAAEAAMASSTASKAQVAGKPWWERLVVAPRMKKWYTQRAVLIGDAAHGMPINLAQGAAASIEGAYLLGEQLCRAADTPEALESAFAAYQAAHEPRIKQCEQMAEFTARLAQPASPRAEAVRNAMRFVPERINGAIFDASLARSLGDAPQSTRSKWPLATS